jgi:hypothetical protein
MSGTSGGSKGPKKAVYRKNQSREVVVKRVVDKEMLGRSGSAGVGSKKKNPAAGPEEWMEWCAANKVLVGQMVELTHYEIESCRRHFMTLKFKPSDEGAAQKTLAESFHRAEVFSSFNEALLFCNKLARSPDALVTFTDMLNAANGSSFFKRNKVTSYMKFVASSELFQCMAASAQATMAPAAPPEVDQAGEEASRSTLSSLVNGAAEMLAGVFTARPAPGGNVSLTLVSRQKKTNYQRQESGETFRNYSLRKGTGLAPPSPSGHLILGDKPQLQTMRSKRDAEVSVRSSRTTVGEARQEQGGGEGEGGAAEGSTKSAGPRGRRPSLQRLESGELRIRPAVKLKKAVIKIYATNRLLGGTKVAIEPPPPTQPPSQSSRGDDEATTELMGAQDSERAQ